MNTADPRGMCPNSAQMRLVRTLLSLRAQLCAVPLAGVEMGSDQQKRPPADRGASSEPPIGIEPMTYSLRVNRSGRLS